MQSHDPSDLEEALEVVDLADGHGDQHQSLEEGPQHDARVRALVDGSVNFVSDIHVVLLVLHSWKKRSLFISRYRIRRSIE